MLREEMMLSEGARMQLRVEVTAGLGQAPASFYAPRENKISSTFVDWVPVHHKASASTTHSPEYEHALQLVIGSDAQLPNKTAASHTG